MAVFSGLDVNRLSYFESETPAEVAESLLAAKAISVINIALFLLCSCQTYVRFLINGEVAISFGSQQVSW